jgi:hypothetical protein
MIRRTGAPSLKEDRPMLSLRLTLPCALGIVLLAGAGGCQCGRQEKGTAPKPGAPAPVVAPTSAPAPASAPKPEPQFAEKAQFAGVQREFAERMQALATGGNLIVLWRELPAYAKRFNDESKDAKDLRHLVAESAGFLVTCEAVRDHNDTACLRLNSLGASAVQMCQARASLFGQLLPAMAERRPCDAAMLARVSTPMKVPAGQLKLLCEAVSARDPARCPGPENPLGVTCSALAAGDAKRCGTPEELEKIKGRSDCPATVEALGALAAKKPLKATGYSSAALVAVQVDPKVRCETEFQARFKELYAAYVKARYLPAPKRLPPPPGRGPAMSSPPTSGPASAPVSGP